MLVLVALVLVWLASMTAPQADAAVGDYLGLPVRAVTVEIEGAPVSDPRLLELVETPLGEPLTMARVRESMAHLFSLGRFEDLQVDASRLNDGVRLRYSLTPLQLVTNFEFRGTLGLSSGELRRAITDRFGNTPPPGRAADMVRALETLYEEHGYRSARIVPSVDASRGNERTLIRFQIEAGPQATVGRLVLEGQSLIAESVLFGRLGLRAGGSYAPAVVSERIASYAEDLRSKGYYLARVDQRASYRDDGRTADVTAIVEPGPSVSVVFRGDAPPNGVRGELVPIAAEQSADEDLVEDSSQRIEEYFRAQGYRDAHVEYSREEAEGQLRIVFTVTRGPQYRVERGEITGNTSIATPELQALVRLREGQPLVSARLNADVAAFTETYRRRGYADVKVEPRIIDGGTPPDASPTGPRLVTVRLVVTEGVRSVVGRVEFEGNRAISTPVLQAMLSLSAGQPFYSPFVARDRDVLLGQYLNRGYEAVVVTPSVTTNEDGTTVDLRFTIAEGEQVFVDHILVVGNTKTRTEIIERELQVRAGQPLSVDALAESQARLSALGLFRRVRITELRHGSANTRDLLVTIEEAPATTVGYGGGVEGGSRLRRTAEDVTQATERLEFAPRGFFEVGRRNLWGKNRSINLFTRVSLRPKDQQVAIDGGGGTVAATGGGFGFSEYSALVTYREPRVLQSRSDVLVIASLEQAIRSSFNFARRGVRGELTRRLTPQISIIGRYAFDRTRLFDERINPEDKLLIDRLFPRVRLSSLASSVLRDTRDDQLDPGSGTLINVDGQFAARHIGSEVGFAKGFAQGYLYKAVPGTPRLVVAGGARVGLVTGFPRQVERVDDEGQAVVAEVRDVPASERFFAGGDTTVRGFALDRLGAPGTIDTDGFPQGGHALVVLNGELRTPYWKSVGGVLFVDVGNVFAEINQVALGELRATSGFGLRYRSPVGPIRADVGFKLARHEVAGQRERLWEIHISFGQAF